MKSNSEAYAGLEDKDIFHKISPFFIWLLRDMTQSLPRDCENIKDYFLTKVFKEQSSSSSDQSKNVVRSILSFFPGFDAFALPIPTVDPEVLKSISDKQSQINPAFLSGLKQFRQLLKDTLVPKNSFNDDELVSGEGLAQLVELYTKAINTPGAIPNVQNTWDVAVQKQCSKAKKDAMKTYNDFMMSELSPKLPCDSDEIRKCHDAAFAQLKSCFAAGLSTNTVEKCFIELKISMDETLDDWYTKNANSTRDSCNAITKKLSKQHLDPVRQQLDGEDAAKLSFHDFTDAYDRFKEDYEKFSIGAQDVIAQVLLDFQQVGNSGTCDQITLPCNHPGPDMKRKDVKTGSSCSYIVKSRRTLVHE
ncbi:hypothetical protein OS493_004449 [Desmophyllum pertusum]|uniref:Uncharacterized protein n=1 Tax=Desmophyllum pertusum TaxID=174260 RepID=A0A9W9ZFR0_9CNID|nr:hypothetical protein OS493_004449 [Desmophyllum pertusum]